LKGDVQERTRLDARQDLTFKGGDTRSDVLLSAEQIHFDYGNGIELIGGLDLLLQRGLRLAILGPNGCGKSTLLKLLLGDLEPTTGSIQRHPKLSISAISQGRAELDGSVSILDNLADRASVVEVGGNTMQAHVYLTRFGFAVDQQGRLTATLSGGERNRLLLAKAMLHPADLLVLDEPTNDLDIPTLQNLEEALMDYPGTLLLVSHDRFFLDQVATHTLAWNAEQTPRWELYEGNPSTVRRLRAERASEAVTIQKKEAAKIAPKVEAAKTRKPGLSQKEARRLAEVESAMAELNARIAQFDAILVDPSAFMSAETPGHQALKDREVAKSSLDLLEMEWLELEEKRAEG
jgi:ATP-binding cassette subfamily F protein uup